MCAVTGVRMLSLERSYQALVEVLDGCSGDSAELLLQCFFATLILTECQPAFSLAGITAHQAVVGLFQPVVDGKHLLPVNDTFVKLLCTPGNLGELVAGFQIRPALLITAAGTPIAVKRLNVVAAVEIHHGQVGWSGLRVIVTLEGVVGLRLEVLQNRHIVPYLPAIKRV